MGFLKDVWTKITKSKPLSLAVESLGGPVGIGVGLLGNYLSSRQQKDQENMANQQANMANNLYGPQLEAQKYGLDEYRGVIEKYLKPAASRTIDPTLSIQHQANLGSIADETNSAMRQSGQYWRSRGNESLARGEQFRAQNAGLTNRLNENRDFMNKNRALQDAAIANLTNAASGIAGMGQAGVNPYASMISAANQQKADASASRNSGIADMFASLYEKMYNDELLQKLGGFGVSSGTVAPPSPIRGVNYNNYLGDAAQKLRRY